MGAQSDASKESAQVPLYLEPTINKDVKDTIVNLSDEDADLYISDICAEILGSRKKRSNTEECATPKKKEKVASKPTLLGGAKTKEPSSATKKTNLQACNLKPLKPKSRKKLL